MGKSLHVPPILQTHSDILERLLRTTLQNAARDGISVDKEIELEISLATALLYQRKIKQARKLVDAILAQQPANNTARWLEMLLAFLMNDPWPSVWQKLEARWGVEMTGERPILTEQLWDGTPLAGRSILLAGEGGLGDCMMFVRFAQSLKERGASRVIVSAPTLLHGLLQSAPGVDEVISARDRERAFQCDVSIPMMSVPYLLGVTKETLPRDTPYLHVPPIYEEAARAKLAESSAPFRVGICWQSANKGRQLPIEVFRPLADIPGVHLYGLGEASKIESDMHGFPITGLASSDILCTAGLIQELDLVVSTDTMVAHLAGSLGRPVWLCLQFVADWRWGPTGERTPWYPTMRIFREKRPEGSTVFKSISNEVGILAARCIDSTTAQRM